MKLYYSPGACSLSPHIVLREAGLDFSLALASTKTKKLADGTDYLTIDMAHLNHERVRVLYLDVKNRLILDHLLTDGSIDEAAIHPREVVKQALDSGASALILVHNHPSGSPEPSRADVQITQRIAEAGRLLGIVVHDHVIIGKQGHVSLKAKGLI